MKPLPILFTGVILVLGLFVSQLQAAVPEQAYLSASEDGQALLLSRLGECYAMTPKHVIGDDLFATLVGGMTGAPQGDADLLQTFGYDLAILRTTGKISRQCGGSLTDVSSVGKVLSTTTAAIVSSINEDGSVTRRNVTINDVALVYIRLRPQKANDQLFKRLSGSLVLASERPIGILMSVDPETGEGLALRYDRAIETLRPFFGLPAGAGGKPEKTQGVETAGAAELIGQVVSWSSPPLGANYRASNLVDPEDVKTIWLARANNFPIELIMALPGDEAHVVDAVRLVGQGVEPGDRLPRDFEVLISSVNNGGGWISVSSGTYFKNEAEKLVRFVPVRARRIMLRIYSNWGDSEAVGLSAIRIPPAN
jgi:hypothetical protein